MKNGRFFGALAAAFALSFSQSTMAHCLAGGSCGRRWPGNPSAPRRRRKLKGWQKEKR
jgi:hypothetical protein